MSNTKMTDKQKVTTMADSDYVFGNFGGKVGQMSIPDFRSHLYDDSPEGESPELSALKSRISSVEDKNTEQDTRINALLQEIPWEGYHMNAFTDTGEYHIHGESTDANDGLPILNSGTIDARLTVLDSSLTNGTGEKTDTVVTQILRLSNRMGGDGHVFVRTGQAATKAELNDTSSTKWGTWEKLMGIFEKNAVSSAESLNGYTTNGMYSGMFVFGNSQSGTVGGVNIESGSTFLLIVVNGYSVGEVGLTPQATQLLYLLPSGGIGQSSARPANMYVRTAIFNKSSKKYDWGNFDRFATAREVENVNTIVGDFEALKVEFEKVKNSIGVNIYGCVRVSGVSDPQLTFRRYIAGGAAGNPLDVIHPCLVEKGTGKLLHVLQNLNFEKDINGAPRKIDGSEGEVYITNTEPIYHITGHVYVNGVSYDVFLRSLYPFTWQGKEAEVIEPFGLSPDNCVAHKDDDGVTRMHSVYNPEWAGSYQDMNGLVGKFVYDGVGDAITETYDENEAIFGGAGGLHTTNLPLAQGELYAMNLNSDRTKTVPFYNEHAKALEVMLGHLIAEGGTFDAHNSELMGAGFCNNDVANVPERWEASDGLAVNGVRYLGGDNGTTRYVALNANKFFQSSPSTCISQMLNDWRSPWRIMERQRVMKYAIEHKIPELTWFAFDGNKYKWRSINGFAGPNSGVMTCVVWKMFSSKFGAGTVDPTVGASLEGHRVDFLICGAMYRGWSTDASPSRWVSGLIFTEDSNGLYKAYYQPDQSKLILSNASENTASDITLPFETDYDLIGEIQGMFSGFLKDYNDHCFFLAKDTNSVKGGSLHTHLCAKNSFSGKKSNAGTRSVRGFKRGHYSMFDGISPYMMSADSRTSYGPSVVCFGTCVQITKEP